MKNVINKFAVCCKANAKSVFIWDSIINDLFRHYPELNVNRSLFLGISGEIIEELLYRILKMEVSLRASKVIVHIVTNNLGLDDPPALIDKLKYLFLACVELYPNHEFHFYPYYWDMTFEVMIPLLSWLIHLWRMKYLPYMIVVLQIRIIPHSLRDKVMKCGFWRFDL